MAKFKLMKMLSYEEEIIEQINRKIFAVKQVEQ